MYQRLSRKRFIASIVILSLFTMAPAVADEDRTAPSPQQSIPQHFDSSGSERLAIQALLDTYTRAVSTKDQALFETLLLSKTIPFSYISAGARASELGTANYAQFQQAVFSGQPFTQRFTQVRIESDGALATVSLVFINTRAQGESWGWKTLHLLQTAQGWKIASEFYTVHS